MTESIKTSRPSGFRTGLLATLEYPRALLGTYRLKPLPYDTEKRRELGLTLLLSGIEGRSSLTNSVAKGLVAGGVDHAIDVVEWTYNFKPAVVNLWMPQRNRQQAARIASMICDYQDRYPGRPVTIMGHSGGAALIPLILEELPPGRELKRAIMIAPALSPKFDLSTALSKVSEQLYHFCSRWDLYFLGFGTLTMGTLDRKFCASAGNRGFKVPKPDTTYHDLYQQKMTEIRYHRRMLGDWHYGGHLSCLNRVFIERNIAPIVSSAKVAKLAIETQQPAPVPEFSESA